MSNDLDQEKNDITIRKSKHNRENPYAQISRKMLCDPDLSLRAKGLLAYLLSLPDNWKIYHSQLSNVLNCSDECIASTLEELIKAGYAYRERKKNKNGQFAPYIYDIVEDPELLLDRDKLKKSLPDRIFRTGETGTGVPGPEKPELSNKQENKKQEITIRLIDQRADERAERLIVFAHKTRQVITRKFSELVNYFSSLGFSEEEVAEAVDSALEAKPKLSGNIERYLESILKNQKNQQKEKSWKNKPSQKNYQKTDSEKPKEKCSVNAIPTRTLAELISRHGLG